MNPLFEQLMREAGRLTRAGALEEATRAIQRSLGAASGGARTEESADAAHPASPANARLPARAAHAANHDRLVIDVEARVLADALSPSATEPAAHADLRQRTEVADAPSDQPAADEWIDGLFTHQNRQVAYKLFVPAKGANSARPLVLMLHGCTQDPDDFALGTGMNRLAREHGFMVLYPAQTQHANSSRCWNWFKPQHQARGRGEPALLAALTRSIATARGADPQRIYVAGLSAGGAMADILGRAYPELFAAVGVHSGLPTGAASDLMSALTAMQQGPQSAPPAGGRAPPTIVFHGDADGTVHARNGEALRAAALSLQPLAEPQGGTETGRSPRGRAYTRRIHRNADGVPAVEHWSLHGAGHAWSGGSAEGSYTDPAGPDASAAMLRFFLAQRGPSATP